MIYVKTKGILRLGIKVGRRGWESAAVIEKLIKRRLLGLKKQ
jgi:hypothetical protein